MTVPSVSPADWAAPLDHVRDEELRAALSRLFVRAHEAASTSTTDGAPTVVLLVSRRLSCVFDMLVASGMDLLDGCEVMTDRALDGGASDLRGRRVILLDDSIVLGTTLVDLYDDVVSRTGRDDLVTVMVAAIDADRYNPAFTDRLHIDVKSGDGAISRSTKDLEGFAFDVASCLYRAGIPYFTDFPACTPVSATREALDSLLSSSRWFVADVSAPKMFAGETRRAWTLVPTSDTAERIRGRGAAAAMAIAEVLKVRVYASIEGSFARGVRVVPIGVPGAVADVRLDEILAGLRKETGFDVRCDSWRPRAKHRLVQMYLSACVLAELWPELTTLGFSEKLDHSALDQAPLRTYFGSEDAEVVFRAFDTAISAYQARDGSDALDKAVPLRLRSGLGRRPEVRHRMILSRLTIDATQELAEAGQLSLLSSAVEPDRPAAGKAVRVDPFWVLHLLLVFGFVDRELERPQEEMLRSYDYDRYVRYRANGGDDTAGPRVLKQGITMHELTSMILPDINVSDAWCASLTSLAVDLGNDLGIVVPTTLEDSGVVSRQYRSGETAYLAGGAPEDLARQYRDDLRAGNLFCWAVLEDLMAERPAALEEFYRDLDAVVSHAVPGELTQAWQGVVTERLDEGFRASVESRLIEGEIDVAELSASLVDENDAERVLEGARFDWIVWRSIDAIGKPELIARVRLAPSAASLD